MGSDIGGPIKLQKRTLRPAGKPTAAGIVIFKIFHFHERFGDKSSVTEQWSQAGAAVLPLGELRHQLRDRRREAAVAAAVVRISESTS